jgi:hypothetical protein
MRRVRNASDYQQRVIRQQGQFSTEVLARPEAERRMYAKPPSMAKIVRTRFQGRTRG